MTNLYETALNNGIELMQLFEDELNSPLKQAASDVGITEGEEMQKYMTWAYKQLGV